MSANETAVSAEPLLACPNDPDDIKTLSAVAADVYRYMNFDQIAEFKEVADTVTV